MVDISVNNLEAYLKLSKLITRGENICIHLEALILSSVTYMCAHMCVHTSVCLEL